MSIVLKPGDVSLTEWRAIYRGASATLAPACRPRAYPASVDSIPTSANQKDHVSMAAHGARRLLAMVENAADVIGIELLAAAQGADFHAPLTSNGPLEAASALLRKAVPHLEEDRHFHPDTAATIDLVRSGQLIGSVGVDLLPPVAAAAE